MGLLSHALLADALQAIASPIPAAARALIASNRAARIRHCRPLSPATTSSPTSPAQLIFPRRFRKLSIPDLFLLSHATGGNASTSVFCVLILNCMVCWSLQARKLLGERDLQHVFVFMMQQSTLVLCCLAGNTLYLFKQFCFCWNLVKEFSFVDTLWSWLELCTTEC
jgi:hypothetical protein